MKKILFALALLTILYSCEDSRCTKFEPYNFTQQYELLDKTKYSEKELSLILSYLEKYKIRTMENAKDIYVKDLKYALIEANFPVVNDFCSAIEAEKSFLKKTNRSEEDVVEKYRDRIKK